MKPYKHAIMEWIPIRESLSGWMNSFYLWSLVDMFIMLVLAWIFLIGGRLVLEMMIALRG